jgi:hypothetical protein
MMQEHGISIWAKKNEQLCLRCGKSFWAWDTGRMICYLCAPPDRKETERILGAIEGVQPKPGAPSGNGAQGGHRR